MNHTPQTDKAYFYPLMDILLFESVSFIMGSITYNKN